MEHTMEALIVIDFINDIIHEDGKLAKGKGYAVFAEQHGVLDNVNEAIARAKERMPLFYIGVGFEPGYSDQPKDSPLFGKAQEFGVLELGTWGTRFHENLDVEGKTFTKNRVSAFYGTGLHEELQRLGVDHVYVCGVATDLAVEAAARDAHDRDYRVSVLSDCCAAATAEDHARSLETLSKIATVGSYADML